MPWFTSDGVNLYLDVCGAGAPLLLLHAWSLDHRQWAPQTEAWRGELRLFRLDWRGHGKSAPSPGSDAWSVGAADAHRALVQVGMDRQHPGAVIAHGHACDAALQLARREPRALRALVLVAPILGGAALDAEWQALLAAMRAAAQAGDVARAWELWRADRAFAGVRAEPELLRSVQAMQERCSGDWLRAPQGDAATAAQLAECKVPILVVTGSAERDGFAAAAAAVAAAVPQAQRAEIPGAAHFPNLEKPEAFDRVVREFLVETA